MDTEPSPVARAIEIVGGPTAVSWACKVSAAAVFRWRKLGYVPDAKAAVLLSRATDGKIGIAELAGLDVIEGGAPAPTEPRFAKRRAAGRAPASRCFTQSAETAQTTGHLKIAVGQN